MFAVIIIYARAFKGLCRKEKNMNEKKYETESKCESGKALKGVSCDVKNCAYHSGVCECHAGCISVGPSEAKSSSGTACATFKPKAY